MARSMMMRVAAADAATLIPTISDCALEPSRSMSQVVL
jgi:hypothetical protein